MKYLQIAFFFALTCLASGCFGFWPFQHKKLPQGSGKAAATLGSAVNEYQVAQSSKDAQVAQLHSKLLADSNQIISDNLLNPEGNPKVAVNATATLISQSLTYSGAIEDPEEKLNAAKRSSLYLSGQLADANKAVEAERAQRATLGKQLEEAQAAIAAKEAALAQLQVKAAEEQKQYEAKIAALQQAADKAKKDAQDALNKWWTIAISSFASLCVVGGIVITVAFPLGKTIGASLSLAGAVLLGCIRFLNSPAFPWFFGGGITLALGATGWLLYHQYKTSQIETTMRKVVQGVKDESGPLSEAWKAIESHIAYWLPNKGAEQHPLAAEIDTRNAAQGINASPNAT